MNRLKYSRCYVIGPMDYSREKGREYRAELEPFLTSLGIICLNPYTKPLHSSYGITAKEDDEGAKIRAQLRENGKFDELTENMKFVRNVDLRMVDHSDFIICQLNFDIIMTGTMEELFTANRQKKPIIIISSLPKEKMPPWLFATCNHELFFTSIPEVKEYIRHINEDKVVDTLNRWVFFDLEPRINEIYRNSNSL